MMVAARGIGGQPGGLHDPACSSCDGTCAAGSAVTAIARSVGRQWLALSRDAAVWPELAAALAAVALYLPALAFGFVFDDRALIGPEGPRWLGNGLLPYRPLRFASYWLDHAVGGGAPVYHATNLVLHAAAAVLVVRLARRLGGTGMLAALAGLLFAVHPLAVEAVAYVSGRRDLLATTLGLASVVLWLSPKPRTGLALAALLLAVAAKESGLLFLPLLVLASVLGVGPPAGRIWKPLLATALVAVVLPVVYGAVGPIAVAGAPATQLTVAGRLAAHYGAHLVWPARLSVAYPALRCDAAECARLAGTQAVLGVSGIAGLALASAWLVRRHGYRSLAFAVTGLLVLVIGLVTAVGLHEPGADRHAYPLLAWLAAVVAAVAAVFDARGRNTTAVLACVAVIALATASVRRVRVWRDDASLWTATVATSPRSPRARYNLAALLAADGDYRPALRHLRHACAIDPAYAPAHLGLAAVACALDRHAEAAHHLETALALGADGREIDRIGRTCGKRENAP
jgi:tetratricopeptide (TPR) repeat protein